jgi:uncharacterized protein (DUF924 family)
MTESTKPADVITFWRDAGREKWFTKSDAFDAEIRRRFLATHEAAAAGRLSEWESTADGALALMLLLDQFPRNLFRGDARTYATDPQALAIADRSIAKGFDTKVDPTLRNFFYLPFMHSEAMADQERCVALYRAAGDTENLKWAEHHADIVRKYGRFPHRNALLGRKSTPEEQAYLDADGFKG